jgi:hypothetical protein
MVHPVLLRNVASNEVIPIWPLWVPLATTALTVDIYKTPVRPVTLRLRATRSIQIFRRLDLVPVMIRHY